MLVQTKHYGTIESDNYEVIDFEKGLPGFEQLRRFVILEGNDSGDFKELQSIENSSVCFIVTDALVFFEGYNPTVPTDELAELGQYDPEKFESFNIVKIPPSDIRNATINLRAPVVINHTLKKGKQIICLNDEYDVRQPLFGAGEE